VSDILKRMAYPQRQKLNDEVHARPPDLLPSNSAVSYFARIADRSDPDQEHRLLNELLEILGLPEAAAGVKHYAGATENFRLRWERHTEFSRYAVAVDNPTTTPFARPAIELLPQQWLQRLEGSVLTAIHTRVLEEHEPSMSLDRYSEQFFNGNVLVGSHIADGAALALTDFRIGEDGFTRLLVLNDGMSAIQTGRMVQRLLEIDTYRMMTLLALPVALALIPRLDEMEIELDGISNELSEGPEKNDQRLLDRLIHLEAESEAGRLHSQFRFSAAEAYYDLVEQRSVELREKRIRGLQTYDEFVKRRLAPAVKTCRAISSRHSNLSHRLERATQLLSTRVNVDRQLQNQKLLKSMNQRARMQLRLQATVEGLSVAAITYYVVGLVYYALQGLVAAGLLINPAIWTAVSVPIVALVIFLSVRRIRRHVSNTVP